MTKKNYAAKRERESMAATITKKSYLKSIEAIRRLGFKEPSEPQTRTNPFTGKAHVLEPLAVMLYDFVVNKHLTCGVEYTRRDWDNARYAFCETWPEQYFDLLD